MLAIQDYISVTKAKSKFLDIIRKTIYEDIASLHNLKTPSLLVIEKLYKFVLASVSGELNINKLANEVGDHIADILRFLVAKPMNSDTLKQYALFSINFFGKKGLKWLK